MENIPTLRTGRIIANVCLLSMLLIFLFLKGVYLNFAILQMYIDLKFRGGGGLSPNIPLYAGFAVNMISGKNLAVNV